MSATSASEGDAPGRSDGSPLAGVGSTRFARAWPKTVLALWLVACAWLGMSLRDDGVQTAGDLDGLIPVEHRAGADEPLLMLELDPDALDPESASTSTLSSAASMVAEALGEERVPIAAPRRDVEAWLDEHALYLLPPEAHEALRVRLTNAAMTVAIEGLRAQLSSPLFGVSGQEARRDPLRLAELTRGPHAPLDASSASGASSTAEPTPTGDLLARDGDALLVQLRTERAPQAVLSDVRDAVAELPVRAAIVGPTQRRTAARALVRSQLAPLALATTSGLAIVLALALRKVRPALAIITCLASAVVGVALATEALDMLSFPMLVLLFGFGCDGALHLQRISERGWPAAAVLGTALLPLWLSPYPQWRTWSWMWLLGVAASMLILRLVLPALLSLLRGSTSWARGGFELRPMRLLAASVTVAVLAGGAWASEVLEYRGADRLALGDAARPPMQLRLHEEFFDPSLVAEARSEGRDAAGALEQAAIDTQLLSTLVPGEAVRLDSPGTMVLLPEELERRRVALRALELPERMRELRGALEARGFRPDAFGEFLRGASDLEDVPSASAAVQGPLGAWVGRFVEDIPDGAVLRSRVHLVPDPEASVPIVEDAGRGRRVELFGPVVAARLDRDTFRDWLGIYAICQIWLGALVVWLGTRNLGTALSAAFAALVTETAVLWMMVGLGQPIGPHMVPALLLGGAAAMVAAGRSCRAVDLRRPLYAMGLLVTSACQIVAGLALVATDVPLWVQIGLITAMGSAIASGVGLFVAPGLARLLRRAGPVATRPPDPEERR